MDFSDKRLYEQYEYETFGIGNLQHGIFNDNSCLNGFNYGKWLMDITVGMWKEDYEKGKLNLKELYEEYPKKWLDKIFNK